MRFIGVAALCFTIAIIACSEDKAIVNHSSDDVDNSAAKMTISGIKAGGGGRRPNLDGGGTRELVGSTGDTKGLTVSNVRAGGYRGKTPNRNPFLASIGDKSVTEGTVLSFTLSGSDADADELTFTVSGNPSGSSLSDDVFTWAPGVDDAGTYAVTFSVSDGSGGSASEQIDITVLDVPDNSNPILASIGDQSVAEGSILSFTLSGSDADADELTYTVSGNPSGSSLSDDVFTWTPGVDDAGTYTVTFSVSDGNGGSDTEEINITVSDTPAANSDPILTSIGDQSVAEGSILSFTLSGSDADGDDLGFAVSGNPSGSSLSDDAFTWTPGYEDAGTYTVTFSVSDGNGGSASEDINITVSDTCNEPTCYRGDISITVSGKTCQSWTAQSPHEHTYTPDNFPDAGLGEHNYCRSAGETYAWCYTTDPSTRYEECNVVK